MDLNEAVQNTVTVARNEWKYVAELELDLQPDLPPVTCVGGEITQVILNLIVNAAHAIEAKAERGTGVMGRIGVSTRVVDGEVEIAVADSGTGIAESIRERIFEPFFTTKEVGRGTGQGLSIARSIVVEKHRGRILLETEVGRGTVFRVRLPRDVARQDGQVGGEPEGSAGGQRAAA